MCRIRKYSREQYPQIRKKKWMYLGCFTESFWKKMFFSLVYEWYLWMRKIPKGTFPSKYLFRKEEITLLYTLIFSNDLTYFICHFWILYSMGIFFFNVKWKVTALRWVVLPPSKKNSCPSQKLSGSMITTVVSSSAEEERAEQSRSLIRYMWCPYKTRREGFLSASVG